MYILQKETQRPENGQESYKEGAKPAGSYPNSRTKWLPENSVVQA